MAIVFDQNFQHPASGARHGVAQSVVVTPTIGNADIVDIRGMKFIALLPPANVNSITIHAAHTEVSSAFKLVNSFGTSGVSAVAVTVWNTLTGLEPYGYIKIQASASSGVGIVMGKY